MTGSDKVAHAAVRRRARRFGIGQAALGAVIGWTLESWYGVFIGGIVILCGLYLAFAYLPLAARIRRAEERRRAAA